MSYKLNLAIDKTPHINSIQRINKIAFVSNKKSLLKKGIPFIITDLLPTYNEEVLFKKIDNYFNNNEITIRSHSDIKSYANARVYKKMTIREYFILLNTSKTTNHYAANIEIDNILLDNIDLQYPIEELKDNFQKPKIWIGSKGTNTPLHVDSTDNFSYQLLGSKRWRIFSIHDNDYLYFERNNYGALINPLSEFSTSLIDLDNVDPNIFPLFSRAKMFEVIINAGEVLYLPYGWGHSVENITTSVMINFWFEIENNIPFILVTDTDF